MTVKIIGFVDFDAHSNLPFCNFKIVELLDLISHTHKTGGL